MMINDLWYDVNGPIHEEKRSIFFDKRRKSNHRMVKGDT